MGRLNKSEGLYRHYYRDGAMHRHLSRERLREAERKEKNEGD